MKQRPISFLRMVILLTIWLGGMTLMVNAQTAADYLLTTTTTPSTCQKNGIITAKLTKKDEQPTDPNVVIKVDYDIRKAGTQESVIGGYRADPIAANLPPGTYDVYAKVYHFGDVEDVEVVKKDVSIANEYVPLILSQAGFFIDTSSLGSSLNCIPTSEYQIQVTGKHGSTYKITFKNKPAAYPGEPILDIPVYSNTVATKVYRIQNLPPGEYTIHISNDCEGIADHSFTIKAVEQDLPISGGSNSPINLLDMTCSGVRSLELYKAAGSSSYTYNSIFHSPTNYGPKHLDPSSPNAYRYMTMFYEHAIATRQQVNDIDANTLSINDLTWIGNKATITHSFRSPYPTLNDLKNPTNMDAPARVYLRIKNSSNAAPGCQPIYINIIYPEKARVSYSLSSHPSYSSWVCGEADKYVTYVSDTDYSKTTCKRTIRLYELDADGNIVGEVLETYEQGSTPSNSNGYTYHFKTKFDSAKKYRACSEYTDVNGDTGQKCVDIVPPEKDYLFGSGSNIELSYGAPCTTDVGLTEMKMTFSKISGSNLAGKTLTLVDAPTGYTPTTDNPNSLMMQVGVPLSFPDNFAYSTFYPMNYSIDASGNITSKFGKKKLPDGNYVFKLEDAVCAPGKELLYSIELKNPIVYSPNNPITALQLERDNNCDRIRIYPFRGKTLADFVVDSNGGFSPSSRITFSGTGIKIGGSSFLWIDIKPENINTPAVQNYYITMPRTQTASLKINYAPSYDPNISYTSKNTYAPNYPYVNLSKSYSSSKHCAVYSNTIDIDIPTLTYNRDTYYAYKCIGGDVAYMGIEAINGVGPYTYTLSEENDPTKILAKKEAVPAGEMVHFTIDRPAGDEISNKYRLVFQDLGCPGQEKYEVVEVYNLSTTTIRDYSRKVCVGVNENVSPINRIDGIISDNMHYTWTLQPGAGNIIGLMPTGNGDEIRSSELSLPEGTFTPQTAIYKVEPTYGSCPGQSFNITFIVSPCINYWYGTSDTEWNKPDNWTEDKVPDENEDVIFATDENNPLFDGLTKSGAAKNNLVAPVGNPKIIGNLVNETTFATVIPPGASLTVKKSVIGSSTPNDAGKLVVQSGENKPNGSLILSGQDCNDDLYGTVQLYAKGFEGPEIEWEDDIDGSPTKGTKFKSSYHWQHFGVPVETIKANPTFHGSFLREYNEKLNHDTMYYHKWSDLNNTSDLIAFKGYEITQKTATTYSIAGKLQFCDKDITLTRSAVPVTGATGNLNNIRYGLGQNIFGNSYTASIEVNSLEFPDQVEPVVYLYNTGRFGDWGIKGGLNEGAQSAGQYTSIPKNAASIIYDGKIPSMNGFLLIHRGSSPYYESPFADPIKMTLPYLTSVKPNSKPQTVKSQSGNRANTNVSNEPISHLRIQLASESTVDNLWLISQKNTTAGIDDGWDGRKFFGRNTAYIYTENNAGPMQVNADKSIDGSLISFYASNDTEYILTLVKSHLNQYRDLHLYDYKTRTMTPLNSDTTVYHFTADNEGKTEKRFLIVNSANLNINSDELQLLDGYLKNNNLLVISNFTTQSGEMKLFDASGRLIKSAPIHVSVNEIPVDLQKGVYILRMHADGKKAGQKIIIR